jgi:hypothetical protein
VGSEHTYITNAYTQNYKVTIPHSGLRTSEKGKYGEGKLRLSPSHTVGLEHPEFPFYFVLFAPLPSHAVGLEQKSYTLS